MNKIRHLLITGSRGFTGKYLLKTAKSRGYLVHELQSDLTDDSALRKEIAIINPDGVIHCAGISFVASSDQEAFYKVHALGTSNLLSALAALKHQPSKVILASSATVYGNASLIPTPEDFPTSPIDHYAMSKVAMEEMAKTFFNKLPIIIARPFNYTGPGQSINFLVPKIVDHFIKKASSIHLGNLNIEREFNDIETISDAYFALLEHANPGEIYNLCSGNSHSLHEVISTLIEITKHPIQVISNPDFVRENEIYRMIGNGEKLKGLLNKNQITSIPSDLTLTLQKMLYDPI